jgi:hypothetical protein
MLLIGIAHSTTTAAHTLTLYWPNVLYIVHCTVLHACMLVVHIQHMLTCFTVYTPHLFALVNAVCTVSDVVCYTIVYTDQLQQRGHTAAQCCAQGCKGRKRGMLYTTTYTKMYAVVNEISLR